jgi:hypothetical protein
VTSIGYCAFFECSSLTSITIPTSVTSIGDGAFSGCTGLTSVIIPTSVTSIGNYAFYSSALTSITIPNSVTSIGAYAFYSCRGLTSITIPTSVTGIGPEAFSDCISLTSITVNSGNTMYDSRDNCNAIIEKSSNTLVMGCKNTTIPNSVTSIGSYAFSGCSGLTSITIPNSVTSIGYEVFSSCSGLTSITIPNSVTSIGSDAFSGCSSLTSIISLNNTPPTCEQYYSNYTLFKTVDKTNCVLWVPEMSVNAYKEANGWKEFKNIRELLPGDANVDGVVNAADVVEVVNAIDGKPSDRFLQYNADQDGNGVDASDVNAIVDIIMQK